MRIAKRVAGLVLLITVMMGLLGISGAYLYLRAGLPDRGGRYRLPGLAAEVEIIRDRRGIPHVWAQDEGDLFFAQGFLHAQDRFWQMEVGRRTGRGTLSEVIGERALASDRLARTLGFGAQAEMEWTLLEPDVQKAFSAYAHGVNAWLEIQDGLPLEFRVLGYRPEPWSPTDSLIIARVAAWSQDSDWQRELLTARVLAAVGPEGAAELGLTSGSIAMPGEVDLLAVLQGSVLMEMVDADWSWAAGEGLSGDGFVIGGQQTTGGQPILAAALQAPAQLPARYYEMQLVGGPYDVAGATMPGLPGVVAGRNRQIAWAGLDGRVDVQDLYVERLRIGKVTQVQYAKAWEDVSRRVEEIRVCGRPQSVSVEILTTRHGPVVAANTNGQALALRWVGADNPTGYVQCLLAINRASSWSEFRAVLDRWATPSQIFLYADVAGNIGSACAGLVPLRRYGDGGLPVPGWLQSYGWNGYQPSAWQAATINPPTAYIVAAGAVVEGIEKANDAVAEARAERLTASLKSTCSLAAADVAALQVDVQGERTALLEALIALPPGDWIQERTLPYLRTWDGRYDGESVGAGVFEVFVYRLAHNLLDDDLGPELIDAYLDGCPNHRLVLEALVNGSGDHWVDDRRTPEVESDQTILARSYAEAVEWLGRRFGDLPYEWNWGRVHNVTFHHTLGSGWPLNLLVNRGAMRLGGAEVTLTASYTGYEANLAVRSIPTYRLVVDLGNARQLLSANSTGQSGHPLSAHYVDQIEPWRRGEYHALLLQHDDASREQESVVLLQPE